MSIAHGKCIKNVNVGKWDGPIYITQVLPTNGVQIAFMTTLHY
jgi:hypothetical protein